MRNTGDNTGKELKDQNQVGFLEPIPVDSFIRHQILKMFIDVGLEDFPAQILISIILHGGQIKPATLAKDLHCNPSRLELPDGFPRLIDLNLIAMSHNRPKTVILAIGIEELLEQLSNRDLVPNYFLNPKEAHTLLHRLDKYHRKINENSVKSNRTNEDRADNYATLLHYFTNLQGLIKSLPSLKSLLFPEPPT